MIIETDRMLKHMGNSLKFVERPDLRHTDCSMIYLPHRVCEDCYLLFETMNDIKNYQIDIANYFRNPVDPVNFGLDWYVREVKKDELNVTGAENSHDNSILNKSSTQINSGEYSIYRIMIMFTDLFWNETIPVPHEDLYLIFNFLGNWYKAKLGRYYYQLDYFNINFFKMFYIICNDTDSFIEYVEKNRHMEIKLGYFEENKEDKKDFDSKILNKAIILEDTDICTNFDEFIEFATVELSLQGLKYGEKYRNSLNGLLFKKEKPHYVGKLRCIIRISKEGRDRDDKQGSDNFKHIDISKYNLKKHFNVGI